MYGNTCTTYLLKLQGKNTNITETKFQVSATCVNWKQLNFTQGCRKNRGTKFLDEIHCLLYKTLGCVDMIDHNCITFEFHVHAWHLYMRFLLLSITIMLPFLFVFFT